MKVHTVLGAGLLESAYENCLCHEMAKRGLRFRRQVSVPLVYDGLNLDCGFRLDLLVEEKIIVEVKAVDQLIAVHDSQILTYLKVTGLALGLLINFNVAHLRNGIRRRIMTKNLRDTPAIPLRAPAVPSSPGSLENPG